MFKLYLRVTSPIQYLSTFKPAMLLLSRNDALCWILSNYLNKEIIILFLILKSNIMSSLEKLSTKFIRNYTLQFEQQKLVITSFTKRTSLEHSRVISQGSKLSSWRSPSLITVWHSKPSRGCYLSHASSSRIIWWLTLIFSPASIDSMMPRHLSLRQSQGK